MQKPSMEHIVSFVEDVPPISRSRPGRPLRADRRPTTFGYMESFAHEHCGAPEHIINRNAVIKCLNETFFVEDFGAMMEQIEATANNAPFEQRQDVLGALLTRLLIEN